jgi:hypothetical protein
VQRLPLPFAAGGGESRAARIVTITHFQCDVSGTRGAAVRRHLSPMKLEMVGRSGARVAGNVTVPAYAPAASHMMWPLSTACPSRNLIEVGVIFTASQKKRVF